VEFVLALNRCINFLSPRCASILFGSSDSHSAGKKWEWLVAWLWVIPPIMLAIYHFFFCTPYIFSPILGTGSIPHQGYADNMFALVIFIKKSFFVFIFSF
jgi:hypothetical protein